MVYGQGCDDCLQTRGQCSSCTRSLSLQLCQATAGNCLCACVGKNIWCINSYIWQRLSLSGVQAQWVLLRQEEQLPLWPYMCSPLAKPLA